MAIDLPKEQLLEYVRDGYTDEEIGKLMYCSAATVQRYRAKYGIARYHLIYTKRMYLRMKELGLTDQEVSYIWNCGRRDLTAWKSRVGLSNKRTPIS